ncbi:MAG: preprotein translocase subunit SecG [Clostridia bacterium]|nr:preprotein translocase subunit SecG [Clostridia bacterium]MBR4458792.1 preprotein translocase subunit SecG [Clostridia bacterium]
MDVFLTIVIVLASIFMIVTVLLQSSNAKGLGAISGELTANMNKKQAATVDAKLAMGTKIAAGVFIVAALLLWYFGK